MARTWLSLLLCLAGIGGAQTQDRANAATDPPALTIYNANFGVVKQSIRLDLRAGTNRVSFTDATAHIEPDSVILRDLSGRTLQILEQNYRNDPISQELLLSLNEGKTIDFQINRVDAQGTVHKDIVQGKIVRSGYVPRYSGVNQYGQQYVGNTSPIIEINGRLQFSLPGQPLFPTLGDNTILKPTLDWVLQTDKPGPSTAELSYVTEGMSWHADYNVVAPPRSDTIDVIGWVTMDNQSGKEFANARIKLIAGDVNKIQPNQGANRLVLMDSISEAKAAPPVSEKAFDEYHLYTLERPTTLHDRETKQVQFVAASGVKSQRIYVYNGAAINSNQYSYYNADQRRDDRNYGTQSNPKVWVMQEFKNSKTNNLGMPLPKGRLRFYRRDDDGALEFTGENIIDHTPTDETIRVLTGSAFDIVGERRRTDYKVDTSRRTLDESFEVKVRNHKKEAVEVRVVEKLYRWVNWDILAESDHHIKADAQTVEFRVQVLPEKEQIVTYTVHYWW